MEQVIVISCVAISLLGIAVAVFSIRENKLKKKKRELELLFQEKNKGFPWLADVYADYLYSQDMRKANRLQYKKHPAHKAAEEVREIAQQRRKAEKLYRVLKYKIDYYENLFPWLIEFSNNDDIDEIIKQVLENKADAPSNNEPIDPVKNYLTSAEYAKLSSIERNQRALDRYWQKKKSSWEIGRDYERYIGHLYESQGYVVYYHGIVEGLSDLGRDLICVKENDTEIVQCKNWSAEKQIHEKHVFQLFGTLVAYQIDHPEKNTMACLVTSTNLSERATMFAERLKIKRKELLPFSHYPCIKCNISHKDGSKIYHLPFDQQYDSTVITEERNECYVETVNQAEALGFRRAFKWHNSRII